MSPTSDHLWYRPARVKLWSHQLANNSQMEVCIMSFCVTLCSQRWNDVGASRLAFGSLSNTKPHDGHMRCAPIFFSAAKNRLAWCEVEYGHELFNLLMRLFSAANIILVNPLSCRNWAFSSVNWPLQNRVSYRNVSFPNFEAKTQMNQIFDLVLRTRTSLLTLKNFKINFWTQTYHLK